MTPQKHKVKILCQIQAAGPLPPGPALWTVRPPLSPGCPRAHLWAVSAGRSHPDPGAGKTVHPPQSWGPGLERGVVSLKQDSRPGPHYLWGAEGTPPGLRRNKKAEQKVAISVRGWGWVEGALGSDTAILASGLGSAV